MVAHGRVTGSQMNAQVFYNEDKTSWWPKAPMGENLDEWIEFKDRVVQTVGISQAALATIIGLKGPNFVNLLSGRIGNLRSERWTDMRQKWEQFRRVGAICDQGFPATKHSLLRALMQLDMYYQDTPSTKDKRGKQIKASVNKDAVVKMEIAYLDRHRPGDMDVLTFDRQWRQMLQDAGIAQRRLTTRDYSVNMTFPPESLINRWLNVDENFTTFLEEGEVGLA